MPCSSKQRWPFFPEPKLFLAPTTADGGRRDRVAERNHFQHIYPSEVEHECQRGPEAPPLPSGLCELLLPSLIAV